jgi:type I restriction enzyme R subunit
MSQYKTIAESNNFIVLDKFTKYTEVNEAPAVYQTEAALEKEFIQDLINQGYENPTNITTQNRCYRLVFCRPSLQTIVNSTLHRPCRVGLCGCVFFIFRREGRFF